MRHDPFGASYFLVEIDGAQGGEAFHASFAEVSGLQGEVEVHEIREGGASSVHKRRGRTVWGPVTLRRGVTAGHDLRSWWDEVRGEKPAQARRDVVILLLGRDGEAVRRWTLRSAWPKSWEAGPLAAGSTEIALEALVLEHAGLEQEDP